MGNNNTARDRDPVDSFPWRPELEHRLPPRERLRANDLNDIHALRGHQTTRETKFYDVNDPTLLITKREDELDFLCEDFQSPRALMSCGHAVTPTSLTNWCQKLLEEGRTRFVCGQTNCNVEWSYEEVCRMALLTPQEKMHFDKTLKTNVDKRNTKACPRCKSPVVSSLPHHCGNDDCRNESVKTLRMCPEFTVGSVKCPSIRACPSCGILLQHDKAGCRNVTCVRCRAFFCFVCLKTPCSQCSLAPRQTSIPVWKKT